MLRKKRTDAHYCYDVSPYNHIYPFFLRRRCDSLCFFDLKVDVTNTIKFVKEWNKNHPELKTRLSSVILVAILRTITLRPKVNRFIANRTMWERDELSLNFVVRKDMNPDSPETSTPLYFNRFATFEEDIAIIEKYISDVQNMTNVAEANATEHTVAMLFKFCPQWLIEAIIKLYGHKDKKHGTPKWVRDADGLHTSIFVANIGSIGMTGAHEHHHLYEWGTTSLFCLLGELKREFEKDKDGKVISAKDIMETSFTLDERICDGLYFIQTINLFSKLLLSPEQLLTPVTEKDIPHFMTKKEYKQKLKMQRAESR